MNWLIDPNGDGNDICPKSACLSNGSCYKWASCKEKGACPIKIGGTCTEKKCIIYVS